MGDECRHTHRPPARGLGEEPQHKVGAMVAFFDLDLKQIACGAADYRWPRPCRCGRCGHPKVWGHGFVAMIFVGFSHCLQIRRYRCPACGCVVRLRPAGYFTRHQTDAATIRSVLAVRIQSGRWPRWASASCGRHWLRALKRSAVAVLGMAALLDPMTAFDRLLDMGRIPVSRAI